MVAGWLLSPTCVFFATGIGSALADVFSGYVTYVPVTFIIKGMMALIAFYGFKFLHKKIGNMFSKFISDIVAEIMMMLVESFLYGFTPSVVNIPANGAQGDVGLIIGVVLMKAFEKSKITLE